MKNITFKFKPWAAINIAEPYFNLSDFCKTCTIETLKKKTLRYKTMGVVAHDRALAGQLK